MSELGTPEFMISADAAGGQLRGWLSGLKKSFTPPPSQFLRKMCKCVSFPDPIHNLFTRQPWQRDWRGVCSSQYYVLFHLFLCRLHLTEAIFRAGRLAFFSVRFSPGWSGQNHCPLRLHSSRASSWCSLQKELGQKWQKEIEGLPQTSQWCQGHSHLPTGGWGERTKYNLRKICHNVHTSTKILPSSPNEPDKGSRCIERCTRSFISLTLTNLVD